MVSVITAQIRALLLSPGLTPTAETLLRAAVIAQTEGVGVVQALKWAQQKAPVRGREGQG